MRTQEAEEKKADAIQRAEDMGHETMLLTKSGAMELWVCKACGKPMDIWDSPAQVNGSLPYEICPGVQ
jgi:rubrerythrin